MCFKQRLSLILHIIEPETPSPTRLFSPNFTSQLALGSVNTGTRQFHRKSARKYYRGRRARLRLCWQFRRWHPRQRAHGWLHNPRKTRLRSNPLLTPSRQDPWRARVSIYEKTEGSCGITLRILNGTGKHCRYSIWSGKYAKHRHLDRCFKNALSISTHWKIPWNRWNG